MRATIAQQQAEIRRLKAEISASQSRLLNSEKACLELSHVKTLTEVEVMKGGFGAKTVGTVALEEDVKKLHKSIRVVNAMTYCKIVTYCSDKIEIEVSLEKSTKIIIIFMLKYNNKNEITIGDIHIDQIITPDLADKNSSTLIKLANAYFREILVAGDLKDMSAPLSPKFIGTLCTPKDIPFYLQKINGYVVAFRKMVWHLQLKERQLGCTFEVISEKENGSYQPTIICITSSGNSNMMRDAEPTKMTIPLRKMLHSFEWRKNI